MTTKAVRSAAGGRVLVEIVLRATLALVATAPLRYLIGWQADAVSTGGVRLP
jgi:hypothetical protein